MGKTTINDQKEESQNYRRIMHFDCLRGIFEFSLHSKELKLELIDSKSTREYCLPQKEEQSNQ